MKAIGILFSIILLFSTETHAVSSGRVRLLGEIPLMLGLDVTDINENVDFRDLGKRNISRQKVGEFTIASNSLDSFRVVISSLRNGRLEKTGGSGQNTEHIEYFLELESRQGESLPGPTALNDPLQIIFSGVKMKHAQKRTFDVKLSLGRKNLLPGIYSDTITVQLSAL